MTYEALLTSGILLEVKFVTSAATGNVTSWPFGQTSQSSDGPSQGVGAGVGFGTGRGVGEEVFALAGEGAGVRVGNNVGGCV